MKIFDTVRIALILSLISLVACGGGGTNDGGTITTPTAPAFLSIANMTLPTAVQGAAYSAKLTPLHGIAPFTWKVDTFSVNGLPAGMTLDATTGTISGTPTANGSYEITFDVTDSSSPAQSSTKAVAFTVNLPFFFSVSSYTGEQEYQTVTSVLIYSGGVPPYTVSLVQGSLPPGVRLGAADLVGVPQALGSYTFSVEVQDSYSPPETSTQSVTVNVAPPPLQLSYALNGARMFVNKPFSGNFIASGGTPPYTYKISSGTLPSGVSLSDPATGLVSGTPSVAGNYSFTAAVTDATSTTVYAYPSVTVAPTVGRNDSPSNATRIGNGNVNASISPLLDPTGTIAPDTDYYKLLAAAGSIVHVETYAKQNNPNNPLDTVIEITDLNGARLTTGCNQPGNTSTNFSSPCLNDDLSASPHIQDSALDYKVAGTSGSQTFLVHVLDWSGAARPDMVYMLSVNGVVDQIVLYQAPLSTGTVGQPYLGATISASGGDGTLSYSITSGSVPPGLSFSNGSISGIPTQAGNFNFDVQAIDLSTPPQTATNSYSITVANPLTITTSSLPDATVGVPYSAQVASTGGIGPIQWVGYTLPIGLTLDASGLISGVPTASGTYNVSVVARDLGAYPPFQNDRSAVIPMTIH